MIRLSVCMLLALPLLAEPMTPKDRQRLLAHLAMTESWVRDEVKGLTPEQLAFKPAPDAWSVANVLEHLAVAEPEYWKNLQDALQATGVRKAGSITDAEILWYGIDRSSRAKTGEAREPKGQFASTGKALDAFVKLRQAMTEYAKTTDVDLRAAALDAKSPMDVYQWFLMISSHAQRHMLQIREIKAGSGYPVSGSKP